MSILGFLWIVDGILQLQSASFTQAFVSGVLTPNLQGQPAFIPYILNSGMAIFSMQPFFINLAAAVIQIAVGVLLILPLKRRIKVFALWTSIAWALVVWVGGEGFGNVFTGAASFYTGAPGSVMLYLILAVFLLYPKKLSLTRLPFVAGAIFLFGAFLQLFPTFWSASGVQSIFLLSSADPIGMIAGPVKIFATAGLSAGPGATNFILVMLLVLFGASLLLRPSLGIAWKAAVFLGLIWWFGQDFGGIQTFPTSTATDPQTAPLLMLFLAPLFVGLGSRIYGSVRAFTTAMPGAWNTFTRVTNHSTKEQREPYFGVKTRVEPLGGDSKILARQSNSAAFTE
jgi:hypothetical protein